MKWPIKDYMQQLKKFEWKDRFELTETTSRQLSDQAQPSIHYQHYVEVHRVGLLVLVVPKPNSL